MRTPSLALTSALLVLAPVLLVALSSCDSAVDPPVEEDATAPLRVLSDYAKFEAPTPSAAPFGATLRADGSIQSTGESGATFGSSLTGLWLGGTQGGTDHVNAIWYGGASDGDGNFTTDCGATPHGLFALDADTTYTDTDAWPRAAGAPTNPDGSPRVYGDRMVWGAFCSAPGSGTPYFASPFQGLRVNTAMYAYDREALKDVRFVRYEVTNTGSAPITDLRVGYFSDTDSPMPIADAVAFDATSGLSYVYNLAKNADGDYFTPWVSGFAFLDTPKDAPLLAHRIMRKNHYYDPEFGETGVDSPPQLIYALDGLSNDGEPMIDPTTGAATRFAFTGDPFAGLGWRDGLFDSGSYSGVDVRHLTSAGPIVLGPGETLAFTVVWVTAVESSPEASQLAVTQTFAAVRAEPSLWRF